MYNSLFKRLIFPLSEMYMKTSIQNKMNFLLKSQYWSKNKLEDYQNSRLRKLVNHAYKNVPYYKKLFDTLKLKPADIQTKNDLNKLPLLTKELVRNNTEELRAINYKQSSYETLTSGSTGLSMRFYQTKEDYSWIWGAQFRAWTWTGYEFGDKYVKISLNNSREEKLTKRLQDKLMRSYYIYSLRLSKDEVKKYIDAMIKFKPKLLYGYSSSINYIAEYMNEHNVRLQLKAVITFGDNLLLSYRNSISKAFWCEVYDGYGCGGEGLNVASQCEKLKYHINDELLIVQTINNEASITSLNNYAMPLIRYTPGDLVTLGVKCSCGRHLSVMKSVDGRSKDVVRTENGEVLVVHFFTTIFEYIQTIKQFKVIQDNKKGIKILIIKDKGYNQKTEEDKIRNKIKNAVGGEFEVNFKYVKEIPFEKNGKRRIIESMIK